MWPQLLWFEDERRRRWNRGKRMMNKQVKKDTNTQFLSSYRRLWVAVGFCTDSDGTIMDVTAIAVAWWWWWGGGGGGGGRGGCLFRHWTWRKGTHFFLFSFSLSVCVSSFLRKTNHSDNIFRFWFHFPFLFVSLSIPCPILSFPFPFQMVSDDFATFDNVTVLIIQFSRSTLSFSFLFFSFLFSQLFSHFVFDFFSFLFCLLFLFIFFCSLPFLAFVRWSVITLPRWIVWVSWPFNWLYRLHSCPIVPFLSLLRWSLITLPRSIVWLS